MKKSRSSVPRLPDRCPPGPAPPVRNEGLFATAGRPEPEPPLPPVGPLVAIAVGKTKEGESLPAKPEGPRLVQNECALAMGRCTKLRVARAATRQRQYSIATRGAAGSWELAYLSMTTAGV
jgi:hypothetical protein